jgi:hypothetical protein
VRTPRVQCAGAGEARRRGAMSRRGTWPTQVCLLSPCLSTKNSKFLNRSVPNDEYGRCRSHYPLKHSQMPNGIFLIRFYTTSLSTLNATHFQWTGGTVLWAKFSPFSTQNFQCQSTWKLCPSTNWTTLIKVDFQVFRWNLENAAKVPEDI